VGLRRPLEGCSTLMKLPWCLLEGLEGCCACLNSVLRLAASRTIRVGLLLPCRSAPLAVNTSLLEARLLPVARHRCLVLPGSKLRLRKIEIAAPVACQCWFTVRAAADQQCAPTVAAS
jgi:hypothetical protein